VKRFRLTATWAGAAVILVIAALLGSGPAQEQSLCPLRVVLFYTPTCAGCRKVLEKLPAVAREWDGHVCVERKDLTEIANFAELSSYEDHYHVEVKAPPAVFVGNRALVGAGEILNGLDPAIAESLTRGELTFHPTCPEGEVGKCGSPGPAIPGVVMARFEKFSISTVIGAGLMDGINPCAFTTIVFLISMLTYLGKSRRQLLLVGFGYTAAVFVTYFLLGMGLLGAVKVFSASRGLMKIVAYLLAGVVFALAGWSLVDFIRYVRRHETSAVSLRLPRAVRDRIHKVIRSGLSTHGLLAGSVTVGVVVALLESLCTGQVYLPIVFVIQRVPALRAKAVLYLLLYNAMFIAPLVGVFGVAYFGVGSARMGRLLREHLAALKLGMAVVFALLGTLVLLTV